MEKELNNMAAQITNVNLVYPDRGGDPSLVAFVSFTVADGEGFELGVKSAKLMCDRQNAFYVLMPSEPKKKKCAHAKCKWRNAVHAPFCNGCGKPLNPDRTEGWYIDVVPPLNNETRAAITAAVVTEHNRGRTRQEN